MNRCECGRFVGAEICRLCHPVCWALDRIWFTVWRARMRRRVARRVDNVVISKYSYDYSGLARRTETCRRLQEAQLRRIDAMRGETVNGRYTVTDVQITGRDTPCPTVTITTTMTGRRRRHDETD